jgi:hypothetical protein
LRRCNRCSFFSGLRCLCRVIRCRSGCSLLGPLEIRTWGWAVIG